MNPSGGLAWHWRAWQQRKAWAPTRAAIADWLLSCQPRSQQLLLLGPSAGWMLPSDWLCQFESVTAVDIDPWAPRLFALRHGRQLRAAGVKWRYDTRDALADLPTLLAEQPQACVFFDNLLGQMRFHAGKLASLADITAVEAKLQALVGLLTGREWGSLHDLLSGRVGKVLPPGGPGGAQNIQIVRSAIFSPVQHSVAGAELASGLIPEGAVSPWLDHLTAKVLPPGLPVRRLAWAFRPDYWHVLEAGWVPQVRSVGADASDDAPAFRVRP